jgi:methionyl-tRNA synthetase
MDTNTSQPTEHTPDASLGANDTSIAPVISSATPAAEPQQAPASNKVSIDEFKKIEVTVGHILAVEIVPDADKLLKLTVDLGEAEPRQIVSGIRMYFEDPQTLVGKRVPFATNLEPRVIKGLTSNGMIMAVNDKNGNGFSLLEAGENITPGSRVS